MASEEKPAAKPERKPERMLWADITTDDEDIFPTWSPAPKQLGSDSAELSCCIVQCGHLGNRYLAAGCFMLGCIPHEPDPGMPTPLNSSSWLCLYLMSLIYEAVSCTGDPYQGSLLNIRVLNAATIFQAACGGAGG